MTPKLFSVIVLFLTIGSSVSAQESALTLDQAISIALQKNPGILASQLELEAREARVAQAGAIPNPDFVVFTEDIAGSGQFEGLENSQTTAQLSQRLELGGKRGARRKSASLHRDVAAAEIELKRREIISAVRRQFFAVLLNQERVQWMQELLDLAKQFSGVVVERIQAGKIPPIDQVKAFAVVATAEVDLTRAQRELESARYDLAALLGMSEPQFQSLPGKLPDAPDVSLEQFIEALPISQELKRVEIQVEESKALFAVEKSKSIPDLTVTGGYRRIQTTDDSAFVAGITVPLPLFDRNKGAIEEARKRIRKSEQVKSAVAIQLRNSLSKAFRSYAGARDEAESLQTHVLPANQTSFDAISEGYRLGKYGYLDVLEAQRSLFQSRLQLLRVIEDIHESAAELERITGKSILKLSDQREARNE